MSEWISVKDRLPDLTIRVLVYRANYESYTSDKMHVGYLNGKDQFVGSQGELFDDDLYPHTLVTHWMPLPEPPEKK